jgi:N-methylhydantoinase A
VPVDTDRLKRADRAGIRKAFDALYEHRYAHSSPDEPVEVVNMRVAAVGKRPRLAFPRVEVTAAPKPAGTRPVYLDDVAEPVRCPVYDRGRLGPGAAITGPALIQEHGTTTVMFPGDRCKVAATGELIIEVEG